MNLKNMILSERTQTQKSSLCVIPFSWNLRTGKKQSVCGERSSGFSWCVGTDLKTSTRDFFWGDGNVLCFDWCGGYTRVLFYGSSSDGTIYVCASHRTVRGDTDTCVPGFCRCLAAESVCFLFELLLPRGSVSPRYLQGIGSKTPAPKDSKVGWWFWYP